jgi:acyl-coenzyme A synthetase/AMP-(fatty) acid ligase
LSDWLLQEQVTIYCSVATVYRQFVNSLTKRKQFPQLRHIYIGGEPIYSSDIELFQRHFSRSCVFSASLGTTETGGAVRRYVIDSTTPFEGTVVPIGYPVTDMEIVLLDDDGQPQESEEGEIGVRSEFISPGYWRLSELTARAFLPDPEGGALRIYRTGDMGRMLPDGCLIHIGRKDAQVKIRGQRVEIGEVETALLNLPDVREAAVVVRDDSTGANRLVAYFVPTSSSGPNVSELRRRLSQTLPDSMMPSAFVKMDRLPRTPAEKVNRNSLPEPGRERPELETAFVGARTPIEEKLTEIWSSVLCIEPVGVYDRFLDLGGHSLIAGRIAARVIDAFQVTLPFRSLFEAPTIAEMAVRISQAQVLEAGQEEIQHILDGLDSS